MAPFFFSYPLLPFLLLLLLPSSASAFSTNTTTTTIYDILPLYSLPRGLFPDSVTSYSLHANGSLRVDLTASCYLPPNYVLHYDRSIAGHLSKGSLANVSGVQTSRYGALWHRVHYIEVDLPPVSGRYIYFHAKWFRTKLPIAQFSTINSCFHFIPSPILQPFHNWIKGDYESVEAGQFEPSVLLPTIPYFLIRFDV